MAKARWLDPAEDQAWRAYRRMRTLLDLQLARDLAVASGLSGPDYDVLSTLTEKPENRWRANELAARLLWSTSRLAHHLTRMENRHLISRQPCHEDGRGATIALTETGWAVLQAAAPLHVKSVRQHFMDLLTPEEVAVLSAICSKVVEHLAPGERTSATS